MTPALMMTLALAAPADASPPLFGLPLACELGRTCEIQNYVDRDPGPGAQDYRCGSRTYNAHSGTDFRLLDLRQQRVGVAVTAIAPGKVLRVRDGVQDISIRDPAAPDTKGQECGNGLVIEHGGGLTSQYCHLARGSLVVKPGMMVQTGAKLGLVGLSGDTEFPHVHLTVRRGDTVLDPFAPAAGAGGVCGAGETLWRPELKAALAYKAGAVLNTGFAAAPLDMAGVEAGVAPPTAASAALVAYVRAIGLQAGDRQSLTLRDPAGKVLAETLGQPLPRDQAQRLLYVGKPRPAAGWTRGRYEAVYRVERAGKTVLERRWSVGL